MSNQKHDYRQAAIEAHRNARGKIAITSKMPLETTDDLSIAYTPGVAEPCLQIAEDKELAYEFTSKSNLVAVVSDGSAVLGLGNIGPEAAMPVMEGKCVLFKKFANVDAIPIVLNTQNTDEIITAVHAIAPTFGGINLEDISAPRCFEIEQKLKKLCDIPVVHDDQHGTAIVTLAALINALKITGKKMEDIKVVTSGAGAAGIAIIKLLLYVGVKNVLMTDSQGIIYEGRERLNPIKEEMAQITNRSKESGSLADALKGADVFIGVSQAGLVSEEMVQSMNKDAVIFAMANPDPEITPEKAKAAGARIIATGRSDYPNQINNVLAFPGLFRGALDARAKHITKEIYKAAAQAIADAVEHVDEDHIIPSPFQDGIATKVAEAVKKAVKSQKESS